MGFEILFLGGAFLITTVPLLVISVLVKLVNRKSRFIRITWLALCMQLALFLGPLGLILLVFRGKTSGTAEDWLFYLFLFCVISGVLIYPLAYLLAMKASGWKSSATRLALVYLFVFVALSIYPVVLKMERYFNVELINGENFAFYGRLVDTNLQPLAGVDMQQRGCRWYDENALTTDREGGFSLRGYCQKNGTITIKNVLLADGKACHFDYPYGNSPARPSREIKITFSKKWPEFSISFHAGLGAEGFDDLPWSENSADSPVEFVCTSPG